MSNRPSVGGGMITNPGRVYRGAPGTKRREVRVFCRRGGITEEIRCPGCGRMVPVRIGKPITHRVGVTRRDAYPCPGVEVYR